MKTIPFEMKYRWAIENGECRIITRGGRQARIICWDKRSNFPIVVQLLDRNGNETDDPYCVGDNGLYQGEADYTDEKDILIVVEESESSEFEDQLRHLINNIGDVTKDTFKIEAEKLMAIARKEFEKELPRWKKCEKVPGYDGAIQVHTDCVNYMDYEIKLDEIFNRLPKED